MDAFGGLGQFKKDPAKMTLAERQKQQQAVKKQSAWSGLDSLDSLGGGLPKPQAPQPRPQPKAQPAAAQPQLFDDFFSSKPQAPQTRAPQQTQSLLDEFDVFTSAPPVPAAAPSPAPAPAPVRSQAPARSQAPQKSSAEGMRTSNDHEIAQLVDMGFSDEDAARALGEMGSVRGAINFLMAEAQGRPLPKPKKQEDVYAIASDVGQQVFATASSWFSKGKKQLQKTMEQWEDKDDNGQPAWMRSQERHKQREAQVPSATSLPPRNPSSRSSTPFAQPQAPPQAPVQPQVQSSAAPKSRAELFRERQSQRDSGVSTPRSNTPSGVSQNASPIASTPSIASSSASSRAPTAAPVAAPVEASVDLLGMSTASAPALSSTAQDMVATSRESGTQAFKRGDYSGAVTYFTSSLASIPKGHMLRTLLLSNRAAALLKVGDSHGTLADCAEAHSIMGPVKRDDSREAEAGKPVCDVWVKIVTREAQAYEHLEKHEDALNRWKLLLDNGYSQATFLEGKRRCLKAMDTSSKASSSAAPSEASAKKSQRRGWGTTGAGPSSQQGKAAVEKVRNLNKQQAQSDKERGDLLVAVSAKVEAWKAGKETDLRALLASLEKVLPSWPPVTTADLVSPKKARIVYMKAVARTHPDKVPATASTEVKMIAEGVFIVLNKAWESFREANGL